METGFVRVKIDVTECCGACCAIPWRSRPFARDQGRGLARIAAATMEQRRDLELLVYGHSHVPALARMTSGGVYANAGSWLDAPTFLRVTTERVELRQWDGSAEGLHLDALDRSTEKALA
jgi:hypothetical protein